jgi:hypothetical protein
VVGIFSPRKHGGHGKSKEEIRKENQESRKKLKRESAQKPNRERKFMTVSCFLFYVLLPCSPCFRGEWALGN